MGALCILESLDRHLSPIDFEHESEFEPDHDGFPQQAVRFKGAFHL